MRVKLINNKLDGNTNLLQITGKIVTLERNGNNYN